MGVISKGILIFALILIVFATNILALEDKLEPDTREYFPNQIGCNMLGGTCAPFETCEDAINIGGFSVCEVIPEGLCGTMSGILPNSLQVSTCYALCKDGMIAVDYGEECDPGGIMGWISFQPGDSCEARGYLGGELSCDDQCEVDTSTCISPGHCQDDNGGSCVGTTFISTCSELELEPYNYARSVPLQGLCDITLSDTLELKSASVAGSICCAACGDGRIAKDIIDYDNEVCDSGDHASPSIPNLDSKTCQDFGFDGGNLSCGYDCTSFDTSECWNYKYTYLWVPVGQWVSQEVFNEKAAARADFFMDISPIRDCKERIRNIYLDLNWVEDNCYITSNLPPYRLKSLVLLLIGYCGNEYVKEYHIKNYERAIGLSNTNIYNDYSGFATQGGKVVFSETEYIWLDTLSNPAHELGHTYFLGDEYLYKYYWQEMGLGGCRNPWNRTYTDDDPPLHPCPKNLYPWQTNGSCEGEAGYCCGAYADIIYSGNYTAQGTDCSGSQYNVMGFGFTRNLCGFNNESYNAVERFILCEEGMLTSAFLDSSNLMVRKLLLFNITDQEESVNINDLYVIDGVPSAEYQIQSNYTLNLTDNNDTLINSVFLPVYYVSLDSPNNISIESIFNLNSTEVTLELPYSPDWKWLRIYKNEELLFETDIGELLCNNNTECDNYENYFSCPQDCSQSGADDMCNKDVNSECDPDCAKGVDYDCGPTLYDIDNIVTGETKTVKIRASAFDPNDENLVYSIDDTRFEQRYDRYFYWETEIGDAGTYYFTVSVTDGYLFDEQEVEVIVKPYHKGTGSPIFRKPDFIVEAFP